MSQTSSYDVMVGKIATVMRVTTEPTESTPGDYYFAGHLERATGEGIGRETVDLVADGVVSSVMTRDEDGFWDFNFHLDPGATYSVMAVFAGTAEYEESRTPTYPVTPSKIATVMEVTTPPPATADAGVPFTFAGALKEEVAAVGIVGATVNLYMEGAPVDSTATGADGSWAFDVALMTPGTVAIYAEFPGDAIYLGCSEKISVARWLAPAGLLAVAGGLMGIACLRH